MSATTTGTLAAGLPPASPSQTTDERLELANRLYREFHARCFWHRPRELVITKELIPLVVDGLRKHGGRRGFILSGQLQKWDDTSRKSQTEGA